LMAAANPEPVRGGLGSPGGVFKSTEGGQHWTAMNTGLPKAGVDALAIDPTTPSTLYEAGYGIYKSTNSGQSWTATGLPVTNVYSRAIDPTNSSTLYAGYIGHGVFQSTARGRLLP